MIRRQICTTALALLAILCVAPNAAAQGFRFNDSRDEVRTSVKAAATKVAQGSEVAVAVAFDMSLGWHIWTQKGGSPEGMAKFGGAIHTEIKAEPAEGSGITVGTDRIVWPKWHAAPMNMGEGPVDYAVFEDHAAAYLPISIAADAPLGAQTIDFKLTFQTCNDRSCLPPVFDHLVKLSLEVVAPGDEDSPSTAGDFAKVPAGLLKSSAIEEKASAAPPKAVSTGQSEVSFQDFQQQLDQLGGFGNQNKPQFFDSRDRVTPSISASSQTVARGGQLAVAIAFKMDMMWHIWTEEGGEPEEAAQFGGAVHTNIKTEIDPASGITAHHGATRWPKPHLVTANAGDGPKEYAVYENTAVAYLPITIAPDAPLGEHTIDFKLTFQTCDDKGCLAPVYDHPMQLTVNIVAPGEEVAASTTGHFADMPADLFDFDPDELSSAGDPSGHPMRVSATSSDAAVAPGSDSTVTVTFELDDKWHVWGPTPFTVDSIEFTSVPTKITASLGGEPILTGNAVWPEPHDIKALGVTLKAHEGTFTVDVPIRIPEGTPDGATEIQLHVDHQMCDDKSCLPPQVITAAVSINVDASATPVALFDESDLVTASDDDDSIITFSVFSWTLTIDPRGPTGIAIMLLLAAIGGFLLNLTPCVLPIIPIKILGLTKAAGNPGRSLTLGAMMCLGIIAFWMVLGLAIVSLSQFDSISSLFQQPLFGIGVGLFIGAMGIGMLGAFTVNLPKGVYALNPNHDSVGGSFFFGVMTAVLSTPCTAPFMGTAAAWATTQDNPSLVLSVFAAIAVGMAFPYLILSAFPKLVEKVPRTGAASEVMKQYMGVLMIAVACFFGGTGLLGLVALHPYLGSVLHWWFATFVLAIGGLWLMMRTFQITPRPARRIVFSAIGLGLAFLLGWWAETQTGRQRDRWEGQQAKAQNADNPDQKWRNFDREAFDEAIAAGRTVMVEWTAFW